MTYPRELNLDPDTEEKLISYLNEEITNHYMERNQWLDDVLRQHGHSGGRHLARAQLVQDFFERCSLRRYIAADICQSHAAGLQPVVVAAGAVAAGGALKHVLSGQNVGRQA